MNEILNKVRQGMREAEIDLYYIDSSDCHNSEYVSDYFKVRQYVSGFTGSAGCLVITMDEAVLWTDGRYFLQAEEQLKGSGFTLYKMGEEGVLDVPSYIALKAKDGMRLGYDATCLSAKKEEYIIRDVKEKLEQGTLFVNWKVTIAGDLWEMENSRPKMEFHTIKKWDMKYCGQAFAEKRDHLKDYVKEKEATGYVIVSLDEIAWLFNFRGGDVLCNPVFFSYALLYEGKITLYCRSEKLTKECKGQLIENDVTLREYEDFYEDLALLKGHFLADESGINAKVGRILRENGRSLTFVDSPLTQWKAVKNEREIAGERLCHIWDGAAFVQFLYWIKKQCQFDENGCLRDENGAFVTEISAAEKLEGFRKGHPHYQGPSFTPIVAVKDHGAIVHYEATKESNGVWTKDTFVLMDTGGQYLEGTTDITRTVVLGEVTREMKENYTAVLKGNLHLQHAVFKKGCRGENLDILARMSLWERGLDFNHGTGHGVGCFLNVHEGPVNIRSKISEQIKPSAVFVPGMITSNEPGVYMDGEYGIRLENMMVCVPVSKTEFGEFYGFEPLTMVVWEDEAILEEQLSVQEKDWLCEYHKKVYEKLSPHLPEEVKQWLYETISGIK